MKAYKSYTICASLWNQTFPSHWGILPLYAIAREKSICNCVDLPLLSVYLDVGVIPFSAKEEKRTNVTSKDLSKYQRVDCGDFVLNNQQAWRGSVGVAFDTGIVSPAYIVLSMNDSFNRKYANYLLRSRIMVDQYLINSKSVGSIQRNIYWPALKRVMVPVPPRPEQGQIVRFLDWKVSSINKLIGVNQKQIECLNEKLLTVVNDLLTHGVKQNRAYMKTNMDWASEIPLEWEISRVRNHFEILKRIAGSEGFDVFSVTQQGLKVRNINLYEGQLAANYSGYQFVYPGEFAMNHMDLLTGGVGIADHLGVTSPDYRVFRLFDEERCYAAYYLKIFQLCYRRHAFYRFGRGAANVGRWRLPASAFKNFEIPLPPYDEQIEIVRAIEIEEHKIKTVIDCLQQEIDVLKEFKKRLIADVVTGKIDVRGIEIPEYDLVEEDSDGESEENTESMEGEMDEE
jgi:Restriction endonuclease S subunits